MIKTAPTETHNTEGSYRTQLCVFANNYKKPYTDVLRISREERLSMTFSAPNATPSSTSKIASRILELDVFTKFPGGSARESLMERAAIIQECTKLTEKKNA